MSPETTSHLTRSSELLWRAEERPTKGPRPTLSVNQIVDTAIEVADTDGIEALSMRRVARDLGVGTMSLYRYIPGKAELLDLMLDRVIGTDDPPANDARRNWRESLEVTARETRNLYLRHQWLLHVNWARPVFGPNTLAAFDLDVAGLAGTPLTGREKIIVLSAINGYVTGSVRDQVTYMNAAEETGIGEEEFWESQLPVLERAMATGNYPSVAALDQDSFEAGWDETFEFGLGCLLDGLEQVIQSRG